MLATFAPPPTPEDEELDRKRAALADLETRLADRELDLATARAALADFERHYLDVIGRRYARLDELRARVAEARARKQPQDRAAQADADRARGQARESASAAGDGGPDNPPASDTAPPPDRPESLTKLYRQAARLLHPDLTLDPGEKGRRHNLMAAVNDAYARGDEAAIRAILRDWHASPEGVQGDGPGAELVRVIRKIAQVEKRLKLIDAEIEQLRQGELFKLRQQVDEARAAGRDLLADLATRLDREIAEAGDELTRASGNG